MNTSTTSSYPMITPSLAMLYQITNNNPDVIQLDSAGESTSYMWGNTRKIKLSYEEAIEATKNINSPIWNDKILRLIFNLFFDFKQFTQSDIIFGLIELDFNFLLDIFKQEALERQKGKITFVHGRHAIFKIMNSFVSLITNQEAFFLPRCKIQNKSPKKAKDKYKEIYETLPQEVKVKAPDSVVPFLQERLISTNISILNNIFSMGSSSFAYFLNEGGKTSPTEILRKQIKHPKLFEKIDLFVKNLILSRNEISNVGQSLLMFSFPEKIVDDYVFPSNRGARTNIKYQDLNLFIQKYLGKKLWKKDFQIMYSTQCRIFDLCYYTFGKDDGIEIFEFDQSKMSTTDIEFTIRNKFTIKELVQLTEVLTDLPSTISEFIQWPPEYRKSESTPQDLAEIKPMSLTPMHSPGMRALIDQGIVKVGPRPAPLSPGPLPVPVPLPVPLPGPVPISPSRPGKKEQKEPEETEETEEEVNGKEKQIPEQKSPNPSFTSKRQSDNI